MVTDVVVDATVVGTGVVVTVVEVTVVDKIFTKIKLTVQINIVVTRFWFIQMCHKRIFVKIKLYSCNCFCGR